MSWAFGILLHKGCQIPGLAGDLSDRRTPRPFLRRL